MTKPTTIQDVAEALGMHKSTVSLALSGKGNISAQTRARVLAATQELGYEPNPLAQRLANGHRNPMVCIFSGVLDVGLSTEKILTIQKEMSARSFEAPIYTCPEPAGGADTSQADLLKSLCRQRPQAIICAAPMLDPDVFGELTSYIGSGGTVVSYDVPVPLPCDQVVFDREDNAYQAARFLLRHGHRRLGIGMSDTAPWLSGKTEGGPQSFRLRGFRRALEESGVPVRDEWCFRTAAYERGGAELARRFLQMADRPTGLCIVNDYVALAFMVEVMRAGVRIPEDLSIVGHDDQPIAPYCPVPLTSASHPAREIAQAVVALLLDRLGGSRQPPQTVVIRGEMVARGSVAAPQGKA